MALQAGWFIGKTDQGGSLVHVGLGNMGQIHGPLLSRNSALSWFPCLWVKRFFSCT
jgi:hypothetical protein